jgi:hypothetical protein
MQPQMQSKPKSAVPKAGSPKALEIERQAKESVAVGRAARFQSFLAVSERLKQLAKG